MNKSASFYAGIVYTLLSAAALSLVGLFGKIGEEQFSLFALLFWRFLAALIICLVFFLWVKGLNGLSLLHIRANFFRAFFILGAQGSFYYYIQEHSLLNGVVLLNTGPLFIPLIEWAVLRQRVGRSSWAGLFVSFIGVLCILQPDMSLFTMASFVGLFAGLCQGISQTLFGMSARAEKPELGLPVLFFFCTFLSLVPYLFSGTTWRPEHSFSAWGILLIALLGLFTVLGQLTRAIAYQHGTPSRLSPFLYFAVPLAGLFDWLLFKNPPNFLSFIGTLLVIGGGLLKIYLRRQILKNK